MNFCDATTLHGFRYVSEDGRPNYERVYWLIAILAAYCLVTLVVYDQIERFFKNPVLISMEPILTSISKIPFPAITLCPDSQILSTTFNLSWAIQEPFNSTVKRDEAYNYAMIVCHLHDFTMKNHHLKTFNPEFIHKMMNAINGEHYCKKLISNVVWTGGLLKNACQYFQPTVTYFGACLTFNMLPQDQIFKLPNVTVAYSWGDKYFGGRKNVWSPDTSFKGNLQPSYNSSDAETPPWIAGEGSLTTAVSFFLTIPKDSFDGSCSSGGKGFFGFVHNPAEIPGSSHPIVYTEADHTLLITLTPKIHFIDKRLDRWNAHERGCYFQNERYLQYFKIYTQRNCEAECEANITEQMCNCRAFYHPRTQDIQVCGPGMVDCVQSKVGKEWDKSSCKCLPSCSELNYDTSSLRFKRNWRKHILYSTLTDKNHYTGIYMKYRGRYFSGTRRDLMISLTDFIANVGGLLGLFLGFSCLSVFEVIYFLTFRHYSDGCRK
ncbi:pickpocket protein 28-like isoform X2 [Rhodnius prolixus]